MSTSIANPLSGSAAPDASPASSGKLSELVHRYAVAEFLPPAEWVTRLRLEQPRR